MKTFTILKDRVLWYDGDITFSPEDLYDFILRGGILSDKIHVKDLNEEVKIFNKMNPSLSLNIKNNINMIDQTWNIPDEYRNINIGKFISDKFSEEAERKKFNEADCIKRIDRIEVELKRYKELNMTIILKTIIYVVDSFRKNNIVWGTGRGSSCSSYILYLIGLHHVDSVAYDLDVNEFFN